MALLRGAVTNPAVAQRMQAIFATQVLPAIAALRGESRAAAAPRAGLVSSQIPGLALCRYVLKRPPVVALKRDEIVHRRPDDPGLSVRRLRDCGATSLSR